jgi:GAF domain-containing protein
VVHRTALEHAALAALARRVVQPVELLAVFQEAVRALSSTLCTEHASILEVLPGGDELRLRAGVGWQQGVVDARVDAMPGGYAAHALAAMEPVVVQDLAAERRFVPSPVLLENGIRSSVAVPIPGPEGDGRFGVIGVHSVVPRAFAPDEVAFISSVATLLSVAVARHHQALDLTDTILQALILAGYALRTGDPGRAHDLVVGAIADTRRIIDRLLGAQALPGDLRRSPPATDAPTG